MLVCVWDMPAAAARSALLADRLGWRHGASALAGRQHPSTESNKGTHPGVDPLPAGERACGPMRRGVRSLPSHALYARIGRERNFQSFASSHVEMAKGTSPGWRDRGAKPSDLLRYHRHKIKYRHVE